MVSPGSSNRKEGLIFNIQRFSVHDGPGIRTTVFMKGCPLKCLWCSNPESQDPFPHVMTRDITCQACGACVPACGRGAITVNADGRSIDREKCDNCLACVSACQYDSLLLCGRYATVDEVLAEVARDSHFYNNSGGGVTVSGGEPLSQPDFVTQLLLSSKERGLHTALDTTGYAAWETMEGVLNLVDLVLFDVKHLDPEQHLKATGVDNRVILENLKKASSRVETWIRVPLIAGFNDAEEQIRELAKLAKSLDVGKISLLPYHEGGRSKSKQMGKPYGWQDGNAPIDDHITRLKGIIEAENVPVSQGS